MERIVARSPGPMQSWVAGGAWPVPGREEDRKWRAVSRSTDFAEPYPVEFPPDTAD